MTPSVPRPPELGAPCPPRASAEALDLLATRRSASAQTLGGEGPDAEALADLLRLAARVPDHGKLAPWRFIVVPRARKAALLAALRPYAGRQADPHKAEAVLRKLEAPPVSVIVISRPDPSSSIPVWEQELSAGAVCLNLLIAARAMGFDANWITDWYSYDPDASAVLGVAAGERVAGFVHIGLAAEAPQERPRPDVAARTWVWTPAGALA